MYKDLHRKLRYERNEKSIIIAIYNNAIKENHENGYVCVTLKTLARQSIVKKYICIYYMYND